jgi:hypothetical protein
MSKVISKLVKLAVVSSTLAVLGTTIVMPVAYANNVIGQPDPGKYCADRGYQYSPYGYTCITTQGTPRGVPLKPHKISIPSNSDLCSEQYPGSKFQANPFGCVRA